MSRTPVCLFEEGYLANRSRDITPQNLDFDLGEEFVRDALSGSLKQSLDFIDKAETLPSCGKIATSALLHSCSALEGSIDHEDDRLQPGSDLLIDEESDIYAIRLAVCELAGADRSPPYECRSLVPAARSRLTTVKGWLFRSGATKPRIVHEYYDSVTKAGLKRCLAALYSETNAWVSYSNGKQNAVVMCRAMQSAVERDESRHIAKILTQVAAKTGASLYEASEQINEQVSEIRQQFHELRTAMPKFQADVAAFDADIQQKVQVYWTEFDRAQGGLKSLTESIDHAHLGMKEARTHLDVVLSAHLPELGKALAIASQQVKDSSDKAAAATDLVAYTLQKIQDDATKELEAMGYSLAAINVMVPELNDILDTTVNHAMELQDIVFTQRLELNAAYNETMVEVRTLQHSIQNATETFKGLQKGIDRFVDAVRWVEERTGPLLAVIGLLWRETILYGAGLAGALVSACCFVLAGLGWRRSVIAGLLGKPRLLQTSNGDADD